MASIVFNGLSQSTSITVNKYLYADLHLDFSNPVKRDVSADYDTKAISNAIVTLFSTLPGQNLLNPEYGLNLNQFLFEPCSTQIAQLIGDKIYKGVTVYEPRVALQNINVDVNTEEQTYNITLSIFIPALNSNVSIAGELSKNGYTLIDYNYGN